MEAPRCRLCGKNHWSTAPCPARTQATGLKGLSVLLKAPKKKGKKKDGPMYAPPGECEFCDRRREYARDAMRRKRAGEH